MSPAHYDELAQTGRVPATGETFVSPSKAYAQGYDGVTVELHTQSGTTSALEQVGVRDNSGAMRSLYPDMPQVSKGWISSNAYFKAEGDGLVNVGLGRGTALDTFNDRLVGHRVVQ